VKRERQRRESGEVRRKEGERKGERRKSSMRRMRSGRIERKSSRKVGRGGEVRRGR
jgi:hypothetical protein